MRNLVRRYVTVEQRKAENQGVTEDDVNEIKQDISAFRCELVEILKNSGMNTSTAATTGQGIPPRGSKLSSGVPSASVFSILCSVLYLFLPSCLIFHLSLSLSLLLRSHSSICFSPSVFIFLVSPFPYLPCPSYTPSPYLCYLRVLPVPLIGLLGRCECVQV